jgi:hypothetical protein
MAKEGFMSLTESNGSYVSETTVDLLHDLSRRLDYLWRYDQYIANCDGETDLREHWRAMKLQETINIEGLKKLLLKRASNADF